MSAKLPVISGKKMVKILTKKGFVIKRQRGSHVILQKDRVVFSVPLHKELKKGTLRSILNQAGISTEDLERSL